MRFDDLHADLDAWPADAPSRLDIDRLHAGEISGDAATALRARIAASPEAAAYLAERAAGFGDFDERASLAAIRRGVSDGARRPARWLRWLMPLIAVGGAAALALVVLRPTEITDPTDPTDTVRAKGDLRLRVFRQTPTGAEEMISGAPFAPGDRLRFVVNLPAKGQIAIMGVEESGASYAAWPPPGAQVATRQPAGKGIELPEAVVLDDAQGVERLHLIWCPPAIAPQCEAAGPDAPPRCPAECRTTGYTLRKGEP